MPTFVNVYHQFKKPIFQIPHHILQNRKKCILFLIESFPFLRTLLLLFAAKASFTSSSSPYIRGTWMGKSWLCLLQCLLGPPPWLEISSSLITVTSGEFSASRLTVLPEADIFHQFWKVPCCCFLNIDCPLFSFASSSENYYRSLRLFYSPRHVTLSSACLSGLHSGLMSPMNFSPHRFSLRPCLSNALICWWRVLKAFVLIFRSFILFFSKNASPLEYSFLMSSVYLLILVFNQFKHIYGL